MRTRNTRDQRRRAHSKDHTVAGVMRVTDLVAREHLRPDVILPSVTGQSEFRGNKSEHALKKTASTIMAVATGGKRAASNHTQKKVALARALTSQALRP